VLRQFEYWRELNAQVVILDGASEPIDVPSQLKSSNIRYLHTGTRFNERLATAGQYVDTKYCALLPDDEFYLPSGLCAAIDTLHADNSTIGCIGRCLYFFVDQGRFLLRDAYRDWLPFPDTALDIRSRLHADLPPYKTHPATYAVLRSKFWGEIVSSSYQTEFSSAYTYERLTNLHRTVRGRTALIENLLWMRSMENPPINDVSTPRTQRHNYLSWAEAPEFSSEVNYFRQIALAIIESGGIESDEARMFEERFFVGGVHRQASKEAENGKKVSRKLRKKMLTYSPKFLRTYSKRYVPSRLLRFTGWEGYDLDTMCKSLEARGTRFSRTELEHVRELSLKLDRQIRLETSE